MSTARTTANRFVDADGVKVFYREAGSPAAPVLLLLHGFPSSSFHYRHLLDSSLADNYRLIAPDFPGFGFTEVPAARKYEYTFENLAKTTEAFVDALRLANYSLYLFDYGAPIGFRLALSRPESVTAIVSQNGNIFTEGLGPAWQRIAQLWADNSPQKRKAFEFLIPQALDATKAKYTTGEEHPERIGPEAWWLDNALINRPGQLELQLDLFQNYGTNIELYSAFQDYLVKHQPPVLAVWGKNDPIFVPAGAEAFQRVVPSAEVHTLDAGHFPLELHSDEVIGFMAPFLAKHVK